jgi:uncharacterized protein YndB with AHSA1/START domain
VTAYPTSVSLPSDDEILITRQFEAPKDLVFRAWTTPALVRRWWHANRGEMTVCDIDLRVGGQWRYAMHANAGFEVGFHGEYLDVVPPERIVSTEVFEGAPDAPATTTTTFTETAGVTTVSILVRHGNKAARDMHLESGMEDGLTDALRLVETVALAGVTITRTFAAPPAAVFAAWTEPTTFAHWFGTTATPVDRVTLDVTPGGAWRARMLVDDGATEIDWHGRYVEVDPPRRLVMTLSDRPGEEFELVTVDLTEQDGGTSMTFSQIGGHLDADGYASVEHGWRAFFDDLDALVATAPVH